AASMALFKKRKGADEPQAPSTPAESVEAMRRRARHRLIGAVVLVLAAVIGFPILFDTQPRPVAMDVPIEIPDRDKAKPLPVPQASTAVGQVTPAAPEAPPAPAPAAEAPQVAETPAPVTPPKPDPAAAEKAAKADAAAEEKKAKAAAEAKAAADAKAAAEARAKAAAAEESAKARALLEGKAVETAAADGTRFVVQVGAFAEREKARQAQLKLERAGLKNYTNVADT